MIWRCHANNLPTTTGTVESVCLDVNNNDPSLQTIDMDLEGGSRHDICVTSVSGRPVNCDAIISGNGALRAHSRWPSRAARRDDQGHRDTTLFVNKEE